MVNLNGKRRGQGFLLFVIILLFCMTFVMYILGNQDGNYQSQFFQYIGANSTSDMQNATSGTTGYASTLYNSFALSMGLGVAGGFITAFSIGFPNYVGMFLGVAIALIGLLNLPLAIFNAESALPDVIRVFLIAFFQFLIVIGVIGWLKGNTP